MWFRNNPKKLFILECILQMIILFFFFPFIQPRPVFDTAYKNPCIHQGTQLRCMPYYMVIGVAKCGTTELMDKISLHSDVYPVYYKEPDWFDRKRLQGMSFLQYMEKFPLERNLTKMRAQTLIMGDGSSNYFTDSTYWMDTPENAKYSHPEILIPHLIHHLIPLTKIIVILRDPIERLYSAYKFFTVRPEIPCVYTPTPEDFHERVKYSTRWLTQCLSTLPRRHCLYDFPYRDRTGLPKFYFRGQYGHFVHQTRIGLYSEYLEDWYSVFPVKQILVVTLEQYSANQSYVLNAIYRHLDLEPSADVLDLTHPRNVNNATFPPMLTETRALLQEFYHPFNQKLARLLAAH